MIYNEDELDIVTGAIRAYEHEVFRARCLTVITEGCLRVLGLKRTERLLQYFIGKALPAAPDKIDAIKDKYITVFNEIKRHKALSGRCLSQSLVLRFLLKQHGVNSRLMIGYRIDGGKFDAHAWLERDGVILNDHPAVIANYPVFPAGKINSVLAFK